MKSTTQVGRGQRPWCSSLETSEKTAFDGVCYGNVFRSMDVSAETVDPNIRRCISVRPRGACTVRSRCYLAK